MEVQLNFKGGGSFVELRPQFSSNSETVYVAWKNKILAYASKTGLLCTEFLGVTDRIVGFSVHYYDSYECITACSESGEIITWKAVTHFKVLNKKISLKKVRNFTVTHFSNNKFKAVIAYKKSKKICFCLYDLLNDTKQSYKFSVKHDLNDYLFDACSDEYFAVAQNSSLSVIQLENASKTFHHTLKVDKTITCLACHPSEAAILTGDHTGRVLLWENIFSGAAVKSAFHWHTLPVGCVGFSAAGTRFYSGGEECVLVKWQAENSLQKSFLPRLAAKIRQVVVSPDNIFTAVATEDNAVDVIGPRNEAISHIQHLVIGDQMETGIVVDPKTKALVLNGTIGHIQFYSANDQSLLYNVDVVCQNKLSHERKTNLESTQVRKIAISKSGLWLATLEQRKDTVYFGEVRLKFWHFDAKLQNFKLNTSVEYPHEDDVHELLFQPTENEDELLCVTVGNDRKYKVWQLEDSTTIYRKENSWSFLCVGFFRDLPCKSAAFSIDGSLLAVSFAEIITAWVPESCELKCSLVHPLHKERIRQIEFGIQSHCHLLVSASENCLSVWNILSLTMMWTVPLRIATLIADSITPNMAVITREREVFVFVPNSPQPVYANKEILAKNEVRAAAFVPGKDSNDARLEWHQRSPILFINQARELYSIGSEEEVRDFEMAADEEYSLYEQMQAKIQSGTVEPTKKVQHLFTKDGAQKSIKKYFEAPIHTMIPIRIMCNSLLRSLVLQKAQ